jgi:hypothetical protein
VGEGVGEASWCGALGARRAGRVVDRQGLPCRAASAFPSQCGAMHGSPPQHDLGSPLCGARAGGDAPDRGTAVYQRRSVGSRLGGPANMRERALDGRQRGGPMGADRADVSLRPANADDAELLLAWANDAATRAASFDRPEIAPDVHAAWLTRVLADPSRRLWIALEGDRPVGQVRLGRRSGRWPRLHRPGTRSPGARRRRPRAPTWVVGRQARTRNCPRACRRLGVERGQRQAVRRRRLRARARATDVHAGV